MPSLLREASAEPLLVAEVAALRVAVALGLRTMALDRLLTLLTPGDCSRASDEAAVLAAVERATEVVLRRVRVTRTTCLLRSLIRYRCLRERGVPVTFRMGVRSAPDGLVGHAWIELRGQPVLERESTEYSVTLSHPPSEP